MRILLMVLLAVATPAAAQVKQGPKGTTARIDPCAPIGRTADGKLVYSMKCDSIPAPASPSPPPEAESKEAPQAVEVEPEVRRTGIFGWSYDRR